MACFVPELRQDVLIFGFEHRFRHLEVVPGGELVEQLALHVGAGEAVELLLDLAADEAFQLVEVVKTERLGELLVDLGRAGSLHTLDRHVEDCVLALQIVDRIIIREAHVDLTLVARLRADQLILEARDQPARAELDLHVLAGAALECLAADLSGEVDDDEVADGRGVLSRSILPAFVLARELLELRIDRGIVGIDRQPVKMRLSIDGVPTSGSASTLTFTSASLPGS